MPSAVRERVDRRRAARWSRSSAHPLPFEAPARHRCTEAGRAFRKRWDATAAATRGARGLVAGRAGVRHGAEDKGARSRTIRRPRPTIPVARHDRRASAREDGGVAAGRVQAPSAVGVGRSSSSALRRGRSRRSGLWPSQAGGERDRAAIARMSAGRQTWRCPRPDAPCAVNRWRLTRSLRPGGRLNRPSIDRQTGCAAFERTAARRTSRMQRVLLPVDPVVMR
jgi:hypothetical protein